MYKVWCQSQSLLQIIIHQFIYPSICQYLCLSIHSGPSVRLSVFPPIYHRPPVHSPIQPPMSIRERFFSTIKIPIMFNPCTYFHPSARLPMSYLLPSAQMTHLCACPSILAPVHLDVLYMFAHSLHRIHILLIVCLPIYPPVSPSVFHSIPPNQFVCLPVLLAHHLQVRLSIYLSFYLPLPPIRYVQFS